MIKMWKAVGEMGLELGDKMKNSVLGPVTFDMLTRHEEMMEFRAGLWAGDINLEVLCIWVIKLEQRN